LRIAARRRPKVALINFIGSPPAEAEAGGGRQHLRFAEPQSKPVRDTPEVIPVIPQSGRRLTEQTAASRSTLRARSAASRPARSNAWTGCSARERSAATCCESRSRRNCTDATAPGRERKRRDVSCD
jgi:hypothetical protein